MAHASGNPAWQDLPSTATPITAATLEQLETTLDRAAKPPVCEARLSAGYNQLAGNTWLGMRGQMTATVDPYGMWSGGVGTAGNESIYRMSAPAGWPGRYQAFWQYGHDGSVAAASTAIAAVLLNVAANVPNTGVAAYTELRNQAPGYCPACIGDVVLAEGQSVSFAVHVVQSATWNMQVRSSTVLVPTRAVLRYVGPT